MTDDQARRVVVHASTAADVPLLLRLFVFGVTVILGYGLVVSFWRALRHEPILWGDVLGALFLVPFIFLGAAMSYALLPKSSVLVFYDPARQEIVWERKRWCGKARQDTLPAEKVLAIRVTNTRTITGETSHVWVETVGQEEEYIGRFIDHKEAQEVARILAHAIGDKPVRNNDGK